VHVEGDTAVAAADVYAPASHGALCGSGQSSSSVSLNDREAFGWYVVSEHGAHSASDFAVPFFNVNVPASHSVIGSQELALVVGNSKG
jgi:hypothetical protein